MAHMAIFATAAAGAMVLSAFPLAQAMNTVVSAERAGIVSDTLPHATDANMLAMNACSERDRLVSELEQQFEEHATAVGLVNENAVIEVFVSQESGTWTIIATGTDGMSCILSAGEGWESTHSVRGLGA